MNIIYIPTQPIPQKSSHVLSVDVGLPLICIISFDRCVKRMDACNQNERVLSSQNCDWIDVINPTL